MVGLGLGLGLGNVNASGGTPAPVLMNSVSATALADVDTTFYDGTQTWVSALSVAGYNYFLGATDAVEASDPIYDEENNKFIFTGGDKYFTLTAANTAILNNAHKTTGGSPITFGFAFKTPPTLVNLSLGGTSGGNGTYGFSIRVLSTGALQFLQFDGTTSGNTALATLVANTWYTVFIAVDCTAGSIKYAVDSRTFTAETLLTNPATSDATHPMKLCTYGSVALTVPAGYEQLGFYLFSSLLTNEQLSAAIDIINDRHAAINIA